MLQLIDFVLILRSQIELERIDFYTSDSIAGEILFSRREY